MSLTPEPIAFDQSSVDRGVEPMTDEELLRKAREEAERLGKENQAAIAGIVEGQSARAEGTTNYGQEVPDGAQAAIDRNQSQRDVEIRGSIARRDGESATSHLDRLATDPDAKLNSIYMEEKRNRETNYFVPRERAIREVLRRGVQNIKDPSLLRMASEFVQRYPAEYEAMRREMNQPKAVDPRIIAQAQKKLESGGFADEARAKTEKQLGVERKRLSVRKGNIERRLKTAKDRHKAGRISDSQLEKAKAKHADEIRQFNIDEALLADRASTDPDPLPQSADYKRSLREDRVRRREEVQRLLASRSIARRIARGGDSKKLLGGYNRGGSAKGRFLNPVEVGVIPPRPLRAGDISQSPDGPRRTQVENIPSPDGGPDTQENRQVPVVETQFGEPIIDAGSMSREEFGKYYTRGDRQRISEQIYMAGGDMARRQRQIDAARTSMLDGFLNDEDREQAEQELAEKEQAIHYEFARRQGGKRSVIRGDKAGGKSSKSGDQPTGADLLEVINDITGENFSTIAEAQRGLGGRFLRTANEAREGLRSREKDQQPISLDDVAAPPIGFEDYVASGRQPQEQYRSDFIQVKLIAGAIQSGFLSSFNENDSVEQTIRNLANAFENNIASGGEDPTGEILMQGVVDAVMKYVESSDELSAEFDERDVAELVAEIVVDPDRFLGASQ